MKNVNYHRISLRRFSFSFPPTSHLLSVVVLSFLPSLLCFSSKRRLLSTRIFPGRLGSLCRCPLYCFYFSFLISLFRLLHILHFFCFLQSFPILSAAVMPCIFLFPIVPFVPWSRCLRSLLSSFLGISRDIVLLLLADIVFFAFLHFPVLSFCLLPVVLPGASHLLDGM